MQCFPVHFHRDPLVQLGQLLTRLVTTSGTWSWARLSFMPVRVTLRLPITPLSHVSPTQHRKLQYSTVMLMSLCVNCVRRRYCRSLIYVYRHAVHTLMWNNGYRQLTESTCCYEKISLMLLLVSLSQLLANHVQVTTSTSQMHWHLKSSLLNMIIHWFDNICFPNHLNTMTLNLY